MGKLTDVAIRNWIKAGELFEGRSAMARAYPCVIVKETARRAGCSAIR